MNVTHSANKSSLDSPTSEKSINVLDIVKYLLFYWKWFLLSIVVFVSFFVYRYNKTPYTYQKAISVMVKNPANSQLTTRMSRVSWYAPVNVTNEILQFRSKTLMADVVEALHANIDYRTKRGLRIIELYKQSPVIVSFHDKMDSWLTFDVVPMDENYARVILNPNTKQQKIYRVDYNTDVWAGNIRLTLVPNAGLGKEWFGKTITVQRKPVVAQASSFVGKMSIVQAKDEGSILNFYINDDSPYRANDILNELVAAYNRQANENKAVVAKSAEDFINERLEIIERELGSVESQIESRKVANGGEDAATSGERYISRSYGYDDQTTQINTQIRLMNMVKEYLRNPAKEDELIPTNIGVEDASVASQITLYNNILLRRNRLLDGSQNNPVIAELNNSLWEIRRNIIEAINNAYSGLLVKRDDLLREKNIARSKAQAVPVEQRKLLSIERQQKVKEELYLFLLNKREENNLNKVSIDDNVTVIDNLRESNAPISPVLLKHIALGLIIGLVIPAAVLLVILMLDTAVRTRKEIEEVINVPFLAEIPYSSRTSKGNDAVSVRSEGFDALSEAFRILRTNLGFMSVDASSPQRVITLTSFAAGAGKTFTSVNLASSLAQIDKKVVILDLDLRKGTLSHDAKVKAQKGITHYLSDPSVNLSDIIVPNGIGETVDIIPIGVIAPNPVELLLSKRLDQIIAELKERYDYIVVDNVPLGIVADTSIINRITDITIFVVRSGKLDRRRLPDLQRIYTEKRLTNMAILLNGVKPSGHSYGNGYGGYGYGYGYGGYGYGYGSSKKSWWQFWK